MEKLLSVVMPTYNRQALTNCAVNSIKCDHPALVEIIVVDDNGDTPYVLDSNVNTNGIDVKVIRLDNNVGPGVARSIGTANSAARYIAFLDSDDVYDHHWLSRVIDHCRKYDNTIDVNIFLSGQVIGASLIVRVVDWVLKYTPKCSHLLILRILFTFTNCFHTPSIVVSRSCCYFSPRLRYCEDYFTNSTAIFGVDEYVYLPHRSCILSREQGVVGGESAARWKMFVGEAKARWLLLGSEKIPVLYKLLIPLGFLYQVIRTLFILPFKYIKNM